MTVRTALRAGALVRAALLAAALVLAGLTGASPTPARAASLPNAPQVLTGAQLSASWTGPLSTRGRYIVDANGNRFKLKAGNWDGAQGHYLGSGDATTPADNEHGEVSYNIPLGLDRTPLPQILADLHTLGLDAIRLPFADALIHDTSTVPDAAVAANPQLKGDTPLQVYDAVVSALTGDGFAVILNNHTTSYRWCCGLDGNERWNSGQTTAQWESDWLFMVNRYKANKRVVGADLRNEVRRDTWDDPNWGWYDDHDEYAAFEDAGNKILAADPDMLVIMEGINWYGIPTDITSHGRPMLTPVANLSNTLINSGKLVYSAHFYAYTGPANSGAGSGLGATSDPRYEDFTPAQLAQVVNQEALFVTQSGQHFTAPVWVSEFGAAGIGSTDTKEQAWFDNFTNILAANDTDFAIWPLIGYTDSSGNLQDNWALLSYDANGNRTGLEDGGDWRVTDWNKLVSAPSLTGQVAPVNHWNMLDLDHADYDVSATMSAQPDWSSGNRKGNCPDSERLVALGRSDSRGLCTDANQPSKSAAGWTTVTDERYVTEGDWASGYSKLQCPDNTFAVGYSVHSNAMAALLCAPSATPLPTTGHDVWFDHGDNRPSSGGSTASDWAPGYYKGQCADNEYVAGVAYTWNWNDGGVPDALLCRPLG
ncbi:glycoside hydrolase family 5 protein [Streptacidiphilus jiangxiensis]|uniref:Aryl-phospho-beta-D-glucosidase BglC, GH1 family n=1 Tax=Streptacidiphilus jiangxiensis TaxID=235985 RepID=A0A1H7HYS6_STRJI|nr:cellulase family glycosylhydrolase [Streptacidiphilus jiangxiensis]SEK54320.1 Aryl-phospho-beta-D-glucosidase BglC, GH1 family [Streptacidiphilus jiangxiensis]